MFGNKLPKKKNGKYLLIDQTFLSKHTAINIDVYHGILKNPILPQFSFFVFIRDV